MPDENTTAMNYGRTHPGYDARARARQFNEDHYKGGRALVETSTDSYLSQWKMESAESYAARVLRAPGLYDNLIKRTLLVYQSQLYRSEPNRSLPPALEPMLEDVDTFGTSASEFFKQVSEWAHVHDFCGVLVDAPRVNEGATEQQVIDAGIRPYFELVKATQIIDWEVETADPQRRGRLNHVVIRDSIWRSSGIFGDRREVTRYRLWTREQWAIYESGQGKERSETQMIESGVNRIGEVPLVILYETRLGPMKGITIIDDVALKANALWNAASQRDEAFHYQSFNILAVFSDDANMSELKIGESRGLKLQANDKAEFLIPSAIPFDAFDQFRRECVESVADLVFARTSRQTATAQVESAEKRELDREEFVAMLKSKANALEGVERECFMLAAQLRGILPIDIEESASDDAIEIEYSKEFRVDETASDEWVKLVEYGVKSRVEWYLSKHPGESTDDAEVAIEENLAAERDRKQADAPAFDPNAMNLGQFTQAGVRDTGPPQDAFAGDGAPPEDPTVQ